MATSRFSWTNGVPGSLGPILRRFVMLCACVALGACATAPGLYETKSEISREWPVGTDGDRIVWVKEIAQFRDLGVNRGFWKRVQELLIGEGDRPIVRPYGVLHGGSGRLYLADPGAGVVHCLDLSLGRYSVIGGPDSPLGTPIGLAEDDRGRLYITDSSNGTVYRYLPDSGSLKPFLAQRLLRPTGVAFNPRNKLVYIVDTLAGQIVAADQDGVVQQRLGVAGDGMESANRPTDIAIDATGQIYVTDSLNFRITVLTPEGQVVRYIGAVGDAQGFFSRPKGVAIDSAGHVYVCDALLDLVQVFDASGVSLLAFGGSGSGNSQFQMPSGLFIDRNDYIFVTDTYNRRIQVFRYQSAKDGQLSSPVEIERRSPVVVTTAGTLQEAAWSATKPTSP
jgi:DNA-binding beta-propeller fold protein YncE